MGFLSALVVLGCISVGAIGCDSDAEDTVESTPVEEPDAGMEEPRGDASVGEEMTPLEAVPPVAGEFDATAVCPAGFQEEFAAGNNTCFRVADQDRNVFLALPGEEFEGPRPLMIVFNGTGGTGEGAFNSYEMQDYVDQGFIVVAPSSNQNGTVFPVWDAMHAPADEEYPNPDLDLFDAVLSCTRAHYSVDTNRMYVTGMSAGGIMTNYVLQRRSEILAGGIVGSGIMSLTRPEEVETLGSMAVVVSWGGDNDEWGGSSEGNDSEDAEEGEEAEDGEEGGAPPCETAEEEGGEAVEGGEEEESIEVSVPNISFVEQAAIASDVYESAEGVNQIWCKGNELGHKYLSEANGYFMEFLLAHPKGYVPNPNWTFVAPDAALNESLSGEGTYPMVCEEGTYSIDTGDVLTCEGESGCETFCNSTAVCGLANATVSGVLEPQLTSLGLSQDSTDCNACVTQCDTAVAESTNADADAAVMDCMVTVGADTAPFCGPGIDGVYPYVDLVNGCCAGQSDSNFCTYVCEIINTNTAAQVFFTECALWLPEVEPTFCESYVATCGEWAGDISCDEWWAAAEPGEEGATEGASQACYAYHLGVAASMETEEDVALHCGHAAGAAPCE